MSIVTKLIELSTHGDAESIDITGNIRAALKDTGLSDGVVTVFVPGATGALSTVEYEPGLIKDMSELWERLVPEGQEYYHDMKWGDGNGHSHLRATLIGPSLSIPFTGKALTLGTWQQVIFIDFDVRRRIRRIVLQFMGE